MNKHSSRESELGLQSPTEVHSEPVRVLRDIANAHRGNGSDTQRNRLLAALRKLGSISTIDARRYLDILAPAPRVMELRQIGIEIETVWTQQITESGEPHRIGLYVLRASK